MRGDTVVFGPRGMANLDNAMGSLGEARFSSGTTEYSVVFNGMGAAKVAER